VVLPWSAVATQTLFERHCAVTTVSIQSALSAETLMI
jgi:hypothetical protein